MNEKFTPQSQPQESTEARKKHSEINFQIHKEMLPELGTPEEKVSGYLSTERGGVSFSMRTEGGMHTLDVSRSTSQKATIELSSEQAEIVKPFMERTDISEVRIAKRDGKQDEDADAWVMKLKVGPIGAPTEQTKITLTQEQKKMLFDVADVVKKTRYYVPVALESGESVTVEVDAYPNGTWMAEVPAGSVDELEKNMPEWLGAEIDEATSKQQAWMNITRASNT